MAFDEINYRDDALTIERRKADAAERQASALETIAQEVTSIDDKLEVIRDKVTQIEQHQDCLCRCCTSQAERTEATLQASLNETGDEPTGKDIWDARERLLRDN